MLNLNYLVEWLIGSFIFLFLLGVIFRICYLIFGFNIKKITINVQQLPSIGDKNKFYLSDFYDLKCKYSLNKNKKLLILACDYFNNINIYSNLIKDCEKKEIDYFVFEQRLYNEKVKERRSIGNNLKDIKDILHHFNSEKYNYESIDIVCSGIVSNYFLYIQAKEINLFNNLIILNYSNKGFLYKNSSNLNIFLGAIFNLNIEIPYNCDNRNISINENYNKEYLENILINGYFSIIEYFQMKKLIRKAWFLLKNDKIKKANYFFMPTNSEKLFVKKFSKDIKKINESNYKIYILNTTKNELLESEDKEFIYEKIKKII